MRIGRRPGLQFHSKLRALTAGLLLTLSLSFAGCGLFDSAVEEAADALNEAILDIQIESSRWQQILADLPDSVSDEAADLIRGPVTTLARDAAGAFTSSVLCIKDNIVASVINALKGIRADILKEKFIAPTPEVCSISVTSIPLTETPSKIDIYGYYLEGVDELTVTHVTASGETQLSDVLLSQTPYSAVLQLSRIPLVDESKEVRIDGTVPPVRLAVEPKQLRKCERREDPRSIRSGEARPQLIANPDNGVLGDPEFFGNGPDVYLWFSLAIEPKDGDPARWAVYGTLRMFAQEVAYNPFNQTYVKADTFADGSNRFLMYEAPEGFRILEVDRPAPDYASKWIENENASISGGGNTAVKTYHVYGDHYGLDVGSYTRVEAEFHDLKFTIAEIEDTDCKFSEQ